MDDRRRLRRSRDALDVLEALRQASESQDGTAALAAIDLLYSFAERHSVGLFDYDAYLEEPPTPNAWTN